MNGHSLNLKGYYINLDSRADRRKHFEEKIHPICPNVQRFSAVMEQKHGALGCTKSHIAVLQRLAAETSQDTCFLVLEDDFVILNQANWNDFVISFQQVREADWWDIIVLTPSGKTMRNIPVNNGFARIATNETTAGYIVKTKFIDQLLKTFQESAVNLEADLLKHKCPMDTGCACSQMNSLDAYWQRIQTHSNFYYYHKIYAGQLPGHSDISKNVVNNNMRYLIQNMY